MNKDQFIERYNKLKELSNGKKPLYRDFLKFCGIDKRKLDVIFGRDAYSKLQEECGDSPNRLLLERTPISQILSQYGELVRVNSYLPVIADWAQAGLKPSIEGISKVNGIKWSEIPNIFLKDYSDRPEWKDVVEIIKASTGTLKQVKTNKTFTQIVEKLLSWTPDRKRIIEEGYKIELRNYLEKHFNLEEEVGESNVDLLVNKKFPIEVKKRSITV